MTGLADAEELLLHLSRAEKAQLLQWIARDLGDAFPGIESVPGVCGGDAVVWLLEQARRAGLGDAEILGAYPSSAPRIWPTLRACSRSHRAEIDEQIRANETDDVSPSDRASSPKGRSSIARG